MFQQAGQMPGQRRWPLFRAQAHGTWEATFACQALCNGLASMPMNWEGRWLYASCISRSSRTGMGEHQDATRVPIVHEHGRLAAKTGNQLAPMVELRQCHLAVSVSA